MVAENCLAWVLRVKVDVGVGVGVVGVGVVVGVKVGISVIVGHGLGVSVIFGVGVDVDVGAGVVDLGARASVAIVSDAAVGADEVLVLGAVGALIIMGDVVFPSSWARLRSWSLRLWSSVSWL